MEVCSETTSKPTVHIKVQEGDLKNTAHGYFEAISLCELYDRKLVLQNCHSLAAARCSGSYLFALHRTSCVARAYLIQQANYYQ